MADTTPTTPTTPRPKDTLIRRRVADLVRDHLARRDISQLQFSRAAGVRQSVLSSILTGARADLRADTVAKVARACGLSPTALGRLMYDCVEVKA